MTFFNNMELLENATLAPPSLQDGIWVGGESFGFLKEYDPYIAYANIRTFVCRDIFLNLYVVNFDITLSILP